MSKRVTLTDFEIEQIVKALKSERNKLSFDYQVVQVGQYILDRLISKLEDEGAES